MHSDRQDDRRLLGGRIRGVARIGVFLLLSLSGYAWSADSGMVLLTPPDRSVVQGALVGVSLKLPANYLDDIRIFVNNRRVRLPKRQYNNPVACFEGIELSFGLNDIKVVAQKNGKKVEELKAQVFFRSELSAIASSAPDGFERYLFHDPAQEKACAPCHQLDLSTFDGREMQPEKSPCHQCHKALLTTYRVAHGPAAVWACLSCHDQKGAPKLAAPKPDNKMCDNCHENSWNSMKFGHGPTAAGSCATCHDPHASDYPYFLRTAPRELCVGCHDDILSKPHVVVGFSNNGHPVRKFPDPYHPGKDFNCISCHNPHAGASWTFLNGYDGVSDMSTFCVTCHKM